MTTNAAPAKAMTAEYGDWFFSTDEGKAALDGLATLLESVDERLAREAAQARVAATDRDTA